MAKDKVYIQQITRVHRTESDKGMCRLGYCVTKNFNYQGGDKTVIDKLKNGICPICGGATEKKYWS